MINGQLCMAPSAAVPQLTAQKTLVKNVAVADGGKQDGGGFSNLLGGIQHSVKEKALPDAGADKHLTSEGGGDDVAANLLTMLQTLSGIAAAAEAAPPLLEMPENKDGCAGESSLVCNGQSGPAPQMVMNASLQSGRMPVVNSLPESVDVLQNVATETEKDATITVATVDKPKERVTDAPKDATSAQTAQIVQTSKMQDSSVKMAQMDTAKNIVSPAVSEQPALLSAVPDQILVKQVFVEPVQVPAVLAIQTEAVTAQENSVALQRTGSSEQSAKTAGMAEISAPLQPGIAKLDLPTTPAAVSELDIQLSQSRPSTTEANASVKQPTGPEQPVETVRAVNERTDAKETASTLQHQASDSESSPGSETSSGTGSNQGQSDADYDNQMFTQDLSGQHKGVSAASAKAMPTVIVPQDVPGQVMQQVKDRLVLHEVKPGSQQITLTLSPDSLGELKMSLNLQGQKLSVEIVTENLVVRDAIVLHTAALKESLARQNITMESFDVTTGGQGSGNQGQNQNAWRELAKQQQQQQQAWIPQRGYQTAQADLPSGRTAYQRQQGETMLDIHY